MAFTTFYRNSRKNLEECLWKFYHPVDFVWREEDATSKGAQKTFFLVCQHVIHSRFRKTFTWWWWRRRCTFSPSTFCGGGYVWGAIIILDSSIVYPFSYHLSTLRECGLIRKKLRSSTATSVLPFFSRAAVCVPKVGQDGGDKRPPAAGASSNCLPSTRRC